MKQVKSKITGDIGELDFDSKEGVFIVVCYDLNTKETVRSYYKSLEDLCEEWEDVQEESKSTIKDVWFNSTIADGHFVEIDFISDEEAERAVEKLKAWKRLKDKGFRFEGWDTNSGHHRATFLFDRGPITEGMCSDLDLLFGGEE